MRHATFIFPHSIAAKMETPVQKQRQIIIAKDSWLLKRLGYSQLLSTIRPKVDNPTVLSAVNAVALYLSTGEPDAVFSTFYMHSTSTLFLSKSGAWGPQDPTAVASFMDCLNSATKLDDLLAFSAKRSVSKINSRVQKLARTFIDLHDRLKERAMCWNISDAFSDIIRAFTKYFDPNKPPFMFDNKPETRAKFIELAMTAQTLLVPKLHCLYLGYALKFDEDFGPLLHRLEKVAQYLGGRDLLRFWKKHGDTIRVVWVPGRASFPQIQLETMANGDRHLGALIDKLQWDDEGKHHLRTDLEQTLYYCYHIDPSIKTPPTIPMAVRLHPELQLLLWITVNVLNLDALPDEHLYIGCSKATCLCCGLWINAFNRKMKMNWTTRLGNGNARSDIPDSTQLWSNIIVSALNFASEEVEKGVDHRVNDVIRKEIHEAIMTM